jgi:hypothetical protein
MLVPAESKRGPRKWHGCKKLSDQQERRDFVATASSNFVGCIQYADELVGGVAFSAGPPDPRDLSNRLQVDPAAPRCTSMLAFSRAKRPEILSLGRGAS